VLAARWFHEQYLHDLAALPLPPLDMRDTQSYMSDPATRAGLRVLDLLARNWRSFGIDLHKASDRAFAETAAEQNYLFVIDKRPLPERLDDLAALTERVGGIADEVETIVTNIDAVLGNGRSVG
jgi:hypothetical protein